MMGAERMTPPALPPGGFIHRSYSSMSCPGALTPAHYSGNRHIIAPRVQALGTEPEIGFQSSIRTCAEDKYGIFGLESRTAMRFLFCSRLWEWFVRAWICWRNEELLGQQPRRAVPHLTPMGCAGPQADRAGIFRDAGGGRGVR